MVHAPIYYYVTFGADFSISKSLTSVGSQCCTSGLTKFSLESNRPNLIWIALVYTKD